jgi:hypothetical protein
MMRDLINLVFLGTVMELSWLMDPRTYFKYAEGGGPHGRVSFLECHERAYIIRGFLKFMAVFSERQAIKVIDGMEDPLDDIVDPLDDLEDPSDFIFNRIFHATAVTVYKYKLRHSAHDDSSNAPDGYFHSVELRHNLLLHIKYFRPELAENVERDMAIASRDLACCKTFEWQGPRFTVVERFGGHSPSTG